jgi:perosamine synthetase
VSAGLFSRHLAIPMHANLTGDQVDRVADAVLRAVSEHAVAQHAG